MNNINLCGEQSFLQRQHISSQKCVSMVPFNYDMTTVSGCTRMMSFGEVVSSDKKQCGNFGSRQTSAQLVSNLSPVSPALPSQWWTSLAPARARRCIPPTGKSRPAARSARSRSRTGHSGTGRRTSRATGCSPPSSCSGIRAWSPLYARPRTETARGLRCSGRSSAFFFFLIWYGFGREKKRMERSEFSPRAHGLRGLLVNFPTGRSAAQRRRGTRKSCPADGSASAEELIVKMPECHKRYNKSMLLAKEARFYR